ncbi:MAG TPA: pullulanase-type alpha-1,6-glucosidase [Anaerolineales bacterium]|nr:pullulanase-type alpha-1,6-glucosidase [Anaerolineales bacterium]
MRKTIQNITLLITILITSFSPSLALSTLAQDSIPEIVNIPGTHQDELGCPGEWMPDCEDTLLTYNSEDDVWQGAYEIQPANDDDKKGPRYKAALNGSWGENYGVNAVPGGADIPLIVSKPTQVKFYYDHKTHWITDNFNKLIIVVAGDFQDQLGCKNNDDPGCLRSWLQDPEGDGVYSFATRDLKAGTYSFTYFIDEDSSQPLGDTQEFTVQANGDEIYFGYDEVKEEITISTTGAPKGSLSKQKAIWVNQNTIMWNVVGSPKFTYTLYYSPDANLELTSDGVENGTAIPLEYQKSGPGGNVFERNPYLNGYTAFNITGVTPDELREIVKAQLAAIVHDQDGKVVDVTGVQIPGVLDAVVSYDGPLGITWDGNKPTLRVWAPTARSVSLHLFDDATTESTSVLPMVSDPVTGVWSASGDADWVGKYYLYEVEVYIPSTGKIEINLVTDPYSISLSMNSKRSQIVNLADASLKPQDWDSLGKPTLDAPEDIVIYELHIRDFSISDETVPENLRGTYKAFTVKDSNGMKHLTGLAEAGLTHIHLLPAFDIASVNEDKSTWQTVDEEQLASYPSDSDQQALEVGIVTGTDGFNWGYDPLHYTTPEGSYSTNPSDTSRILEFREMVGALNENGLRVVMDIAYNHTNASGQNPNSVLDRIVPGYYHRLNTEGKVEKSTCCENTASEHNMMGKLMIDSVITWVREYKVDGFRFDLMGHHMLEDMIAVRAALDALTLEEDGVDGKSIYTYGEGWDFGEVANNARGKNATQLNIAGTGIGAFNDRLRDAARGGNPFDDVRLQGLATGLYFANNANENRPVEDQVFQLEKYTDWIRIGLAGNMADYEIIRANGESVPGSKISYNGFPAGYTADPQENIIYVSAHDNQTLFDAIQVKAPAEASLSDRIRMNNMAISLVMFSQGVPFFHAGDDILRSKSFDSNSYDSSDWYNKLDWTYETNNFGVGLPKEGTGQWAIYQPLLADPNLAPTKTDITFASTVFREFLQIRKSSPLFRLQTADLINNTLTFYNNGTDHTPGLIVMRLNDIDDLDSNYKEIVVIFNAQPDEVNFSDTSLTGNYVLHPIQQNSADETVRQVSYVNNTFTVPGRTTVVFLIEDGISPSLWIVAGIIAALIALGSLGFFLSRRRKSL